MRKPDRQEVIDTVYHLIINGESDPAVERRSLKSDFYFSRYRGSGGGCAIGRVLPEEYYTPALEGKSIRMICRENECIGEYFEAAGVDFLEELQHAYDNACLDMSFKPFPKQVFLANFRQSVLEIIERWGLEFPGDVPRTNPLVEIIARENTRTAPAPRLRQWLAAIF